MNQKIPDPRYIPEVISVVGTVDGAGKTTTSVNLAIALAASGRTILLIDLDPRGSIGDCLIRGWHEDGGASRLFGNALITRDIIAATEIPDLYLLPSEEGLNAVEQHLAPVGDSRTRLAQSLETLQALPIRFDLVIVNCPSNLGLITLNALVAANWVLVPIPTTADAISGSGVPALLTTIQRLRGGMKQPLRGVYLLPTQKTDAEDGLIDALRNGYGPMALPLAIPWSQKVKEASQHNKPVLVYAPHDLVSTSYLDLAAEWLELLIHGTNIYASQYNGKLRHEEDSARLRQIMEKRIHAWLVDPSCLLYDAEEARRQPAPRVLDELIELTQQIPPELHPPIDDTFIPRHKNHLFAKRPFSRHGSHRYLLSGFIGLFLLLIILTIFAPPTLRFELAAWLIGPEQYWHSGSVLLFRADETAYRELILGIKLVGNNRNQLLACEEEAQAKDTVVSCTVAVSPE